MNFDLAEILSKTGLSLPDAMEKLSKLIEFIPKAKGYIPMAKELEKSFAIKEGQKVIYSIRPVSPTYTGNETPEEKLKLDALNEILISVYVIEKNDRGETVIVDEPFTLKAFEEIEKISSLFPKM